MTQYALTILIGCTLFALGAGITWISLSSIRITETTARFDYCIEQEASEDQCEKLIYGDR